MIDNAHHLETEVENVLKYKQGIINYCKVYFWADHVSPGCNTLIHPDIRRFFYLPIVCHVTGHVDLN